MLTAKVSSTVLSQIDRLQLYTTVQPIPKISSGAYEG